MKKEAIIKGVLSCLAFIFMTQAISPVSIYSLFIVAILYYAYTEIRVIRNAATIIISIILTFLSIFYLLSGNISNISILIKDVSSTLKTLVICLGNYFFFEAIVTFFPNLIIKHRRNG